MEWPEKVPSDIQAAVDASVEVAFCKFADQLVAALEAEFAPEALSLELSPPPAPGQSVSASGLPSLSAGATGTQILCE